MTHAAMSITLMMACALIQAWKNSPNSGRPTRRATRTRPSFIPKKGHWMDREDAVAVEWMARHTRDPRPKKIVWKQDDVTHRRFYWLAVDDETAKGRPEIVGDRMPRGRAPLPPEAIAAIRQWIADGAQDN